MKQLTLITIASVFLFSCSQQKFGFRKTFRVKSNESHQKSVARIKTHKQTEPALVNTDVFSSKAAHADNSSVTIEKEKSAIKEETIASLERFIPVDAKSEWKNKADGSKLTVPQKTNKTHSDGDGSGSAIAGFILSILGFFVAGIILCTLGIVFSALGLQSKRKGLALAGLILGIIGLVLTIIVLIAIL